MAKKKKKAKSHKRRRRSKVGFAGSIDTQNILGVVVGAVAAGYMNKVIPAVVNDKLVAGGKVALGVALPMFIKSNPGLMKGIGAGMIAVGAVDLLKSFGALSGDFDIPTINGDVLTGADLDVINGIEDGDYVSGDDDNYMGGDDNDDGMSVSGEDDNY